MTISISSRTAVYQPQPNIRPGPKAIPLPAEEPAVASLSKPSILKTATIAPAPVDFSATINTQSAQDPPGPAQNGADAGAAPYSDPGLQDRGSVFGDVNGDNQLNGDDVTALLKAFNSSVTAADLNADGNVDTADLGILISAIRKLNDITKPDNRPGGGPDADLRPISAINVPGDTGPISEPGFDSLKPSESPAGTPGIGDNPSPQPGIFGDLNGDGILDTEDLTILQQSFGQAEGIGDLNGDGRVDTADLGTMLGILNKQKNA